MSEPLQRVVSDALVAATRAATGTAIAEEAVARGFLRRNVWAMAGLAIVLAGLVVIVII